MEREDKQQKITRFKTDKLRQMEITREMERQQREKERQMHREQEKVIYIYIYTSIHLYIYISRYIHNPSLLYDVDQPTTNNEYCSIVV